MLPRINIYRCVEGSHYFLRLFDIEDNGTAILQNIVKYSPVDTSVTSYRVRTFSNTAVIFSNLT